MTSISSSSSATSALGSALAGAAAQSLDDLSKAVQQTQEDINKAKENASKNVVKESYEKRVRKSASDKAGNATNIGTLVRNVSRLNAFGNLGSKDKVDFVTFKNQSPSEPNIAVIARPGINVQILNKAGTVIADSRESAGDKYQNFQELQKGAYKLAAGDYTIKLERDPKYKPSAEEEAAKKKDGDKGDNYIVQISTAKYSKDYDTLIYPPAKGSGNGPQLSQATIASLNGIVSASNNFASVTAGLTPNQQLVATSTNFNALFA